MTVRSTTRHAVSGLLRRLPESLAERARSRAPLSALEVMRHRGIPADIEDFVLSDNPLVRMANVDSVVTQRLYWMGERGWEPEVLPWWRFGCQRATSILELGANIGYFTVQGALVAPSTPYVAVEPHPASATAIRRNLTINGIHNVRLLEAAAVDDPDVDSIELLVPVSDHFGAPAGAFLGADSEVSDRPVGERLRVPAVFTADLFADVDLVKMDVEGQEHRILAAAADAIRKQRPTLFVEVLRDSTKLRSVIMELAEDCSYACLVPTATALHRMDVRDLARIALEDQATRDLILTTDPQFIDRAS